MNPRFRNPWEGLTPLQVQELDESCKLPHHQGKPQPTVYGDVAVEYALRAAHLLTSNDLRGALSAAEIATAAVRIGERIDSRQREARLRHAENERLEAERPEGRLVYVAGHKRRKRVYPSQPT